MTSCAAAAMMGRVHAGVVREFVGPEDMRTAWPGLEELYRVAGCPVTARAQWQEIWVRTHPDWEPWVIALESADGSLSAAAPLSRKRQGPFVRVVGLGHGTSDDARLPVRSATLAPALAEAVSRGLDALGRPWSLLVEQLPADCPVADELTQLLSGARLRPGQGMPMVVVGPSRDPAHYLSRNARSAENKARNRLRREDHAVTERWVSTPEDVAAAVDAMSAVHRARDAQLGRMSDHEEAARASFYREVLVGHAASDALDLLLLDIDGELAAYVAAFRDGHALRVWDNRLAPGWATFSAGRLANHAAVRRVLADPNLEVLDWMRGEEPYKLSSATTVVATRELQAWSSPLARAPYAAKEFLRPLRDRWAGLDRAVRCAGLNLGKRDTRLTGDGK